MKMTPFLSGVNTVVTLLMAAYITIAIGVAGYDDVLLGVAHLLVLIIFLIAIITGWMVALKNLNPRGVVSSLWRITQTVTVGVFLYLTLGTLGRSFGLF